ncbi:hypothetical protein ACQ4PT_063818 [Festuca glaucescens]
MEAKTAAVGESATKANIGVFGDLADGEKYVVDLSLPPRVIIGPDQNGFKVTINYRYDSEGNKVKVTTTTRVRKLACAAVERRNWPKFGDAAADGDRSAWKVVSDEEIYLLPSSSAADPPPSLSLSLGCSVRCGRAQAGGVRAFVRVGAGLRAASVRVVWRCGVRTLACSAAGGPIGVYVPPKRFATIDTPGHGGNGAELLVTNLPQEADETDVKLLFKGFGRLRRVSVAVNPKTGRGKGWATVNFHRKADAEKAMSRVDGHPYGHMILKVGWADES